MSAPKGSDDGLETEFYTVYSSFLLPFTWAPFSGGFALPVNLTRWHRHCQVYRLLSLLEVHQKGSSSFPSRPKKRPRVTFWLPIHCHLPLSEPITIYWDGLLCLAVSSSHMYFRDEGLYLHGLGGRHSFTLKGQVDTDQAKTTCPLPWCHAKELGNYKIVVSFSVLVTPHSSWIHGSQMKTKSVVSEFLPLRIRLVCKALLPLIKIWEHGFVIPLPSCPQRTAWRRCFRVRRRWDVVADVIWVWHAL